MPQEVRIWEIADNDRLDECPLTPLDLESRLEAWLTADISILSTDLMVIGHQVETGFGGFIDVLCIDRAGNLVEVELKRDKPPREVTAQCLDYASWVQDLSRDTVCRIAGEYLGGKTSFEQAFQQKFGEELPDSLNENHRMLIVASRIDPSSERIIKYLNSTYGVDINAVTFHYFKTSGERELLARVFLIDPSEVGPSKRRPNLTYEELERLADQNGVGNLYRSLVCGLERHFQKHTTRSSLGFAAMLDESHKTIFSLLPGDSDSANGLRFQVYIERFKKLLRLTDDQALALIPERRETWKYYEAAGPDYSGFQGYFTDIAEVNQFLDEISARAAPQ